ncbi:MAG: SWIM zinc finger family protein [Erysipelotrichaceae bacterium]|nr:SWIM zinc finger family protein [Erysipelotrichaceae bacterium]
MRFLQQASSESVSRGFGYYEDNRVSDIEQTDKIIYSATVIGSGNKVYEVDINLDKPRTSLCTCPYASGSYIICKHMVATYFKLFEDQAEDFKASRYSRTYLCYEDDEDDYYEDRDYYDDYYSDYSPNREIPEIYDQLLDNYVNNLDKKELIGLAKKRLNSDPDDKFKAYLRTEYNRYKEKYGLDYKTFKTVENEIDHLKNNTDFNYEHFNKSFFSKELKKDILKILAKKNEFSTKILKELRSPFLAAYDDYDWIIENVVPLLSEKEKETLKLAIEDLFAALRYYRFNAYYPKCNLLINIYKLSNFTLEETLSSLLDKCKYDEYLKYVIEDCDDKNALLKLLIQKLEDKEYPVYKKGVSSIFLYIAGTDLYKYSYLLEYVDYYDFLLNHDDKSYKHLVDKSSKMLQKLKDENLDNEHALVIYSVTDDVDNLYKLVSSLNKRYLYDKYLLQLKDKYSEELYNYYYDYSLDLLEKSEGTENYKYVVDVAKKVKKLDGDKVYIKRFVNDLYNSKFAKRRTLFERIRKECNLKSR